MNDIDKAWLKATTLQSAAVREDRVEYASVTKADMDKVGSLTSTDVQQKPRRKNEEFAYFTVTVEDPATVALIKAL